MSLKKINKIPDFVIACDLDEVLGQYLVGYIDHYNSKFGTSHVLADFHSYDFSKVHNKEVSEISSVISEFHESPAFTHHYPVLPGSVQGVDELRQIGDVHVVTARQYELKDLTSRWLKHHFSFDTDRLHIANHYSNNSYEKRSKSQICKQIGAHVLIDDNLDYAIDVATSGVPVVLFDWEGQYNWNKPKIDQRLPDNIHRVTSWNAVVQKTREISEQLA